MSRLIKKLHRGHKALRPHIVAPAASPAAPQAVAPPPPAPAPRLTLFTPPADPVATAAEPAEPGDSPRPKVLLQSKPTRQFLGLDDQGCTAYRRLFDRVRGDLDMTQPRCVCLTSAAADEGKSATAINLAFLAAQTITQHVLVIEANLGRASMADRLGMPPNFGLSDVLANGLPPAEAIRWVAPVGYSVLPAGRPLDGTSEMLTNRRLETVIWDLRQVYDFIIVEAPAIAPRTLPLLLGSAYDTVYLVVRMHSTRRQVVDRAVRSFYAAGGAIRGCIMTHEPLLTGVFGCTEERGGAGPHFGASRGRTAAMA
jgi:Mrp family chromosome partitioning ATPase